MEQKKQPLNSLLVCLMIIVVISVGFSIFLKFKPVEKNLTPIPINYHIELSNNNSNLSEDIEGSLSYSSNSKGFFGNFIVRKTYTEKELTQSLIKNIKNQSQRNNCRKYTLRIIDLKHPECSLGYATYYKYGQKEVDKSFSYIENILEVKIKKKNINLFKTVIFKKKPVKRTDFSIINNGEPPRYRISGGVNNFAKVFCFCKKIDEKDLVPVILYKVFEFSDKGYKHFQVSIFDSQKRDCALATATYYPLGHDKDGKKVENILEVKIRNKNINPFKTVYIQKNDQSLLKP